MNINFICNYCTVKQLIEQQSEREQICKKCYNFIFDNDSQFEIENNSNNICEDINDKFFCKHCLVLKSIKEESSCQEVCTKCFNFMSNDNLQSQNKPIGAHFICDRCTITQHISQESERKTICKTCYWRIYRNDCHISSQINKNENYIDKKNYVEINNYDNCNDYNNYDNPYLQKNNNSNNSNNNNNNSDQKNYYFICDGCTIRQFIEQQSECERICIQCYNKLNDISDTQINNNNNLKSHYFNCARCKANQHIDRQSVCDGLCKNCYVFHKDCWNNETNNESKNIFTACKRCGGEKDPRYTEKNEYCSPFCANHFLKPMCPICKKRPLSKNESYCYTCELEYKFCQKCQKFSKNPLSKYCSKCQRVCIKCELNLAENSKQICQKCQTEMMKLEQYEKQRKEYGKIWMDDEMKKKIKINNDTKISYNSYQYLKYNYCFKCRGYSVNSLNDICSKCGLSQKCVRCDKNLICNDVTKLCKQCQQNDQQRAQLYPSLKSFYEAHGIFEK